ncbi:uncharacterized protein ARMOST_21675 [Armillaria ostoyae]|uniref:Uncharacterized protein n=1 Tax=Armillaria ostoyae TaxID=47428 RepID=A0A284SAP9_ARMOS|nr:uncharacterized protein ARMOST_21675 [Armillaria ostoyae]
MSLSYPHLKALVGPRVGAPLMHSPLRRSRYPLHALSYREQRHPSHKTETQPPAFDSEHLAAIRSLSVVVNGYFDVCLSSYASVLVSMTDVNHVRVSGGSGLFIHLIFENTTVSLITL